MRWTLGPMLVLACRSAATTPDVPPAADVATPKDATADVAADAAADIADTSLPRGTVGEPCVPRGFEMGGDCAAGEFCYPSPGGYCVGACRGSARCPEGSVCVASGRLGDVCLRSCAADADCREGYTCDPAWGACVAPGFAAPRAPSCSAPAPPRARFGPARQVTLARPEGGYDWEPSAALLADGRVVFAYSARPGASLFTSPALHVATLAADGTVASDRVLTTPRSDHYDSWMAADRRGRVHLVWLGHNGGGVDRASQIGYATTDDGETWTAPRAAHDPQDCPQADGCLDKPMVAAGPPLGDGQAPALVVCYAANGARCRRSLDGGATFLRSVAVSRGSYGDVRLDARGRVHFVATVPAAGPNSPDWFGATTNRVSYARSDDGGVTFRTISTVSAEGESVPVYFSNAQVVRDEARGRTHVVYPAGQGVAWNIVVATSRDDGATWTRITANDDAPCAAHLTPTAALDPTTGALHLLWHENRDGRGAAVWTRCDPDAPRCAPNERVSEAPFAAFALIRQSPRWLGEYQALLVDDARRRIHALWTATVSEDGAPVARIFHASAGL